MYLLCGISTFLVLLLCQWNEALESCPPLYQRYSNQHTFCREPNTTCNILATTVTAQHIQQIVRAHNDYRSRIAMGQETIGNLPPATDMLQMEWDKELAAVAQKHAEQCRFDHDCNECRQIRKFKVGQNLYESWSTGSGLPEPDWSSAVRYWYNEVSNFHSGIISPFDSGRATGVVGHFTQVIWSTTWKVGCGYVAYKGVTKTYQLYTCNYGPAGNGYRGTVYQQGATCSKCPGNTSCRSSPNYPGLCQVQKGKRPTYPRKPGQYIYFCDFEPGTDCHIATPAGMKTWKIMRTYSGSYISIVLEGGESSLINVTTTFKGLPEMCLSVSYRKGPNVAGQASSNVVKEHFYIVDLSYDMELQLQNDSPNFMSFGMNLNFNQDIKFSISFDVPSGSPAQYLELKDISVKSGSC